MAKLNKLTPIKIALSPKEYFEDNLDKIKGYIYYDKTC